MRYLSFYFFLFLSLVSFIWIWWARKCDYWRQNYEQNLYFISKFICKQWFMRSFMSGSICVSFANLCGRTFMYIGSHKILLEHKRIKSVLWKILSLQTPSFVWRSRNALRANNPTIKKYISEDFFHNLFSFIWKSFVTFLPVNPFIFVNMWNLVNL